MEQPTLFQIPAMSLRTIKGHDFGEVSSAMQKAIRRGDARPAGCWSPERFASGFGPWPNLTLSREEHTTTAADSDGQVGTRANSPRS